MPRICIILPYFGKGFLNYFDLYLDSCRINSDVLQILLLTDINTEDFSIPCNVRVIKTTLEEMRQKFSDFLQSELNMSIPADDLIKNAYKMCDLRILYGELFETELSGMGITCDDYVGFGDCDLIYGRISNFIPLKTRNYGVMGRHGHFLVWKNIPRFNTFWRSVSINFVPYSCHSIPQDSERYVVEKNIIDYLIDDKHHGLDETYFSPQINQYAIDSGDEIFEIQKFFCDAEPPCKKMGFTGRMDLPKYYDYFLFDLSPEDDKNLRCFFKDTEKKKEILYIHLQKRPMMKMFESYEKSFYIREFSFDRTQPKDKS